jgi:predicted nucleic acid-binding protein
MTKDRRYVLDTNVLSQAQRTYYSFAICPGFWDWLRWEVDNGRVESIDKVRGELERGKDDLIAWAKKSLPGAFFRSTDDNATTEWFGRMVEAVNRETKYFRAAKAKFATDADGWLVAHAKANGLVVVTQERPAKDAKKTVPIPNVCEAFGVPYQNTFEMLTELSASFHWRASR